MTTEEPEFFELDALREHGDVAQHVEAEFLELIALQGSPDVVTRDQVLAQADVRGARVSQRQFTSYVSAGLVPRAARLGQQAGVYATIVVDLLVAITRARNAGLSIDAIRELLPMWRYLMQARRDRWLNLARLERIVRDNVVSLEAAYAVSWVVQSTAPSLLLGADRNAMDLVIVDKSGNQQVHSPGSPVSIGFVVAELIEDEGGDASVRRHDSMRITLPIGDEGTHPTTIISGIPNSVELPPCPLNEHNWQARRPRIRGRRPQIDEGNRESA